MNYSQIDREALAIVFAVDNFYQYLFGRLFTIITDNQSLVRIFHQNAKLPGMTFSRLQRYAVVVYKKSIDNVNADCLSRAPIKSQHSTDKAINEKVNKLCEAAVHQISTPTLNFETLRAEIKRDEYLSVALQNLQNNRVEDTMFTINNGIIFRGQRVVIPNTLQHAVVNELH